ncbi:MAG: Cna B-type domain-containing protein, partial [Actinomycetia bacterium]|nr:Cna B-type domain-containing protein [Actinomycetes bacterium]
MMNYSLRFRRTAGRCEQVLLSLLLVLQLLTPTTLAAVPSLEASSAASTEASTLPTTPVEQDAFEPLLAPLEAPARAGSSLDAPSYGQISLVKFVSLANGCMGGMALDSAGAVWSFGYNLYGELGIGGTVSSVEGVTTPNYYGGMRRIPYFANNGVKIVEIGASYETRYALGSDGVVYAWGQGGAGAMGNGTTTGTNNTPAPVPGLPPIAHIYASDSYLDQASCMALAKDGTLWAWGYNASGQLGLGTTGNVTNPQQVPLSSDFVTGTRQVVKVAVGRTASALIDDRGDLWMAGSDSSGQQGNGPGISSSTSYVMMNRSLSGMAQVIDVDVSYTALQNTSDRVVAADTDGNAWEWGTTFGDGAAAATMVTKQTPQKIVVDPAAAAAVGYEPKAVAVTSSEMVGYFIDQHGRPWSWGSGYYFGFGREGGYTVSNVEIIKSTAAQQRPDIIGDGDTQASDTSAKYPRYLVDYVAPDGVLVTTANSKTASALRGYGFNDLHPTIYDEKYMMKDANGNVLDADGNPLIYATTATMNGVSGLTVGYYYRSSGGATNTISSPATRGIPATNPEDARWINLAFLPVPFVAQFDVSLSAYSFIDADGNLFKWGNDGSGAIGWGWDYNSKYDQNGNLTSGLYDRYTYEVMYMRGAPTIDLASLNLDMEDLAKIYQDPATGLAEGNLAQLNIHVPATQNNAALQANVHSDVTSLKYVIVPYDESDPNFSVNLSVMSYEQFMALYDASADALKGELLTVPLASGTQAQDYSFDINIPVNGRLIVFETTDRYVDAGGGAREYENMDYVGVGLTVDNVYTPVTLQHQGVGTDVAGATTTLYQPTNNNVVKTNNDSAQTGKLFDATLYGVPLDANGQVITSPTYGYDTVNIASYEAVGDVGLPSGIKPYWKFSQPQAQQVSKTLSDASYVQPHFVQIFDYEQDLDYWSEVSGTKTWVDANDSAGKRPDSITLALNQYERDPGTGAKGAFISTVTSATVTPDAQGDWVFNFGYQMSYEYTYEIVEGAAPGYQTTITYPNLLVGPSTNEDLTGVSIVNALIQHSLTKTVSAPGNVDGKYHVGDELTYTITAINDS